MKSLFFVIFLTSLTLSSKCQLTLSGYTLSHSKQPISGAIVEIYKVNSQLDSAILFYSISNSTGFFSINNTQGFTIDSTLRLKVAAIGYKFDEPLYKFFPLSSDKLLYLNVNSYETVLPNVIVKSEIPISQRGDTTIYNVGAFTNEDDKTIGNVIAKLPGVSVDASGNILFNGKYINTYYIQGLNLFEDRYSVPNNNIRPDMVEAVEMINDHQPIRMLDSLKGNSPALNLRLKKNALDKIVGNAKIGGGVEKRGERDFLNTNDAVAAMRFASSMQTLAAYKYSNNGESLSSEIGERSYNIRKAGLGFDELGISGKRFGLLEILTPPISEKLYNLNNSGLFLLSSLLPLKKDFIVKMNTYYLNDRVYNLGEQISNFFLPGKSIVTAEEIIRNNNKNSVFYSSVVFEKNNKSNYLKNTFIYQNRFAKGTGHVENLQGSVNSIFSSVDNSITNDFKTLLKRNKIIYNISSKLSFSHGRNPLNTNTALFDNYFSFLPFFNVLTQNYNGRNFLANTSVGFIKAWKGFRWNLGISDIFLFRRNESNLNPSQLADNGNSLAFRYFDSIGINSGSISQNSIVLDAQGVRKLSDYLTLDLSVPLSLTFIARNNSDYSQYSDAKFYPIYSPSFGINYNSRKFFSFGITASYSKNVNVDDNISALVMNSYRSYRFLNPTILQTNRAGLNISATRNNSLKALFFTVSVFYGYAKNDLLENTAYVGFYSTNSFIANDGWGKTTKLSVEVSKYFNKENINLKLKSSLGKSLMPIAIDSTILINLGTNLTTSLDLGYDWKFINFKNSTIFNRSMNKREANTSSFSNGFRSFSRLSLVSKKASVVNDFDYFINNGTGRTGKNDYFFFNSFLRLKPKHFILEAGVDNILNQQRWSMFLNSPYFSQLSSYNLRGRTYFVRLFIKY